MNPPSKQEAVASIIAEYLWPKKTHGDNSANYLKLAQKILNYLEGKLPIDKHKRL